MIAKTVFEYFYLVISLCYSPIPKTLVFRIATKLVFSTVKFVVHALHLNRHPGLRAGIRSF